MTYDILIVDTPFLIRFIIWRKGGKRSLPFFEATWGKSWVNNATFWFNPHYSK
jgi:hypothetical protein